MSFLILSMKKHLNNHDFVLRFGKRVRYIRKGKDMTLGELSEKTGIRSNYFALIERGEVNCSISHASLLAMGLDITVSDLFSLASVYQPS